MTMDSVITALASGNIGGAVAGLAGGALGGVLGIGAAKGQGSLIGGVVQSSGGGRLTIKTTKGNIITIKRAKHRRYGRRGGGGGMNSMLKTAMQFKMLNSAMK